MAVCGTFSPERSEPDESSRRNVNDSPRCKCPRPTRPISTKCPMGPALHIPGHSPRSPQTLAANTSLEPRWITPGTRRCPPTIPPSTNRFDQPQPPVPIYWHHMHIQSPRVAAPPVSVQCTTTMPATPSINRCQTSTLCQTIRGRRPPCRLAPP